MERFAFKQKQKKSKNKCRLTNQNPEYKSKSAEIMCIIKQGNNASNLGPFTLLTDTTLQESSQNK